MSRRTVEPKWIALLPGEVDLLLSKLSRKVKGEGSLFAKLLQLKAMFKDDAERVKELVKRERASGFWTEEQSANGAIRRLRKEQRQEVEEIQKEIAALPPEEMRELLARDRQAKKLRGGLNR